MEKIDALRKKAQARFDAATTADDVKSATEDLAALDEIEKGYDEMKQQNAALLASYKSIVKAEPVSNKAPEDPEAEEGGEGLDFAAALAKIKAAREKDKGE